MKVILRVFERYFIFIGNGICCSKSNFERHLQSERNMLSLTFAFDHQNHARYGSYQHAYLNNLKTSNTQAYEDLLKRDFGGGITGQSFSTIYGDLITELFNGQTKGTAGGPFRAGFSTDIGAVTSWVKTIHIHCKLRDSLKDLLQTKTS